MRLLVAGDIDPVAVDNPSGSSPFLLLGDHAGRATPQRLDKLGLDDHALARHIALDIGVEGLGVRLAQRLDAAFVRQTYSRLVIDCNRALGSEGSILPVSDGTVIPGNHGLDAATRHARAAEIFTPYHDHIAATLDRRGGATLVVSLHSFTPTLAGQARPWRYGVLHRGDSDFSNAVLAALRSRVGKDLVGDNAPYAMDGADFTIPHHVDPRGLDYLELEVRQDLIADEGGQDAAAELLGDVLHAFAQTVPGDGSGRPFR
ncbi:N-formylglutamate amidohydrolase [Caulobacter segnis]